MATDPKQSVSDDTMPPPIDDVDEPAAASDTPAFYKPTEADAERPRVAPVRDARQEAVEEIVARSRELRAEQEAEMRDGAPPEQDAGGDVDDPAARQPPAADEPRVKLKIDGKEVERPLSEVIAAAQKYEASDGRLEETKRLLAEAKAVREQAGQEPRGHQRHQPATPPDEERREKLLAIAERIQIGDAEEGAEALAELLGDERDLDRRVDQRLAARQTEREIDGAIGRFAERYPDVVKSPLLANAGLTALELEIVRDMTNIGIDPKVIAPLRGQTQALAIAHRQLKANGYTKLRSYDQLLDATGKVMAREFNIAESKGQNRTAQARIERKRAAGPQPRTSGMRTGMAQETRPKTKAEVIADIRRSRGFAPDR